MKKKKALICIFCHYNYCYHCHYLHNRVSGPWHQHIFSRQLKGHAVYGIVLPKSLCVLVRAELDSVRACVAVCVFVRACVAKSVVYCKSPYNICYSYVSVCLLLLSELPIETLRCCRLLHDHSLESFRLGRFSRQCVSDGILIARHAQITAGCASHVMGKRVQWSWSLLRLMTKISGFRIASCFFVFSSSPFFTLPLFSPQWFTDLMAACLETK